VDLDLVFLGTSGSLPTAQHSPAATLLRRGGERLLFDCAEGTQRQLLRSNVGLPELPEIFLTHYHADHYGGLPYLLKTFALRGRETPLIVYGPLGLHDLFAALKRIFGRLPYELELVELAAGATMERDGYRLEAIPVDHGVAAIGYALVEHARPGRFDVETADGLGVSPQDRGRLQRGEPVEAGGRIVRPEEVLGPARPGRKIVLTVDTAQSPRVIVSAHGADVLVHEATFCEDERERAHETLHSTAAEAADVARLADVQLLALTHLSTRYSGGDIAREARAVFPDTVVPRDFDLLEVPFRERGAPQLVKGGALDRPPEPVSSVPQ
jgi:ribonuclease Z